MRVYHAERFVCQGEGCVFVMQRGWYVKGKGVFIMQIGLYVKGKMRGVNTPSE